SPPVALGAPLTGLHLVEASAGTGKTWTLSGLVARLVAQRGLEVERILCVTFTRAAAAELRARIRARLAQLRAAQDDEALADDFCRQLLPQLGPGARAWLDRALASFDDAAIHTIHGFCQRVLADRAFSTGVPFDCEVVADAAEVLEAVVADFWRRHVVAPQGAGNGLGPEVGELFVARFLQRWPDPVADLSRWAQSFVARPQMRVDLPPGEDDAAAAGEQAVALHRQLAKLWGEARETLLALVSDPGVLNQNSHKAAKIPGWAAEITAHLAPPGLPDDVPEGLGKLRAGALEKATKKGKPAPSHAFFTLTDAYADARERLDAALDLRAARLQARLLDWCRAELPRRLEANRSMGYDDLLGRLEAALAGPGGEALARALRVRYPAALIDEFQDTDARQWAIFRRIYVDVPAGAAPLALYLVGDPKQAIYRFRGADIHAYLDAAAAAGEPHRLAENQRSVAPLVAAVNALFGAVEDPFRFGGRIAFHPVSPAARSHAALVEEGRADALPLRFFLCPPGEEGKVRSKDEGEAWAAGVCAAEIARLLAGARAGRASLDGRALTARDIAVLANSHAEARRVREALARLGIACAELSRESVFAGDQAGDLERLLRALVQPQREDLVRAAVATDTLGWSAADLLRARDDEALWEATLADFRRWNEMWRRDGLVFMLRRLMLEREVAGRLAARSDGERRLADLHHLMELLHAQSRHESGPEALLAWLATRRQEGGGGEEAQLRLESDDNAVQLLTIHKSKGLQYPVCFLPFLWSAPDPARSGPKPATGAFWHDADAAGEPALDLGSGRFDAAAAAALREEQAERLRLAYVALTRAQNRCYLVWGALSGAGGSPLGWLLHGMDDAKAAPSLEQARARITELAERAGGALGVVEAGAAPDAAVAEAEEAAFLAARAPVPRVPPGWRLARYSSIVAAAAWQAELPDHGNAQATRRSGAPTPPPGWPRRLARCCRTRPRCPAPPPLRRSVPSAIPRPAQRRCGWPTCPAPTPCGNWNSTCHWRGRTPAGCCGRCAPAGWPCRNCRPSGCRASSRAMWTWCSSMTGASTWPTTSPTGWGPRRRTTVRRPWPRP
ncbi:MAG: UvrD-helicase domain-containing protein, partial [Betaproteobacteria bacterium]|nr:UvrD-helicase domain-containing protein [Betaproteobacteria bacterium]